VRAAPHRQLPHGVTVLSFAGELDLSDAGDVEQAILTAESEGPEVLVLDLREVSFIDSTMLREIVGAERRARRQGRRLAVAVTSEVVRRLFRITLLEWRVEIVDDPADVRPGGTGAERPRHAR
jgi:anti-anti-sigma factor